MIKTVIGIIAISCFMSQWAACQKSRTSTLIKVIELRDYILQPGMYDQFTAFMKERIRPRQESLGALFIDEFKLKDSVDNFVWIRGFTNMSSRSKF